MKDVEHYKKLIQFYIGDDFKFTYEGFFRGNKDGEYSFRLSLLIKCNKTLDTIEQYWWADNSMKECFKGISESIENNSKDHLCYNNYVKSLK